MSKLFAIKESASLSLGALRYSIIESFYRGCVLRKILQGATNLFHNDLLNSEVPLNVNRSLIISA